MQCLSLAGPVVLIFSLTRISSLGLPLSWQWLTSSSSISLIPRLIFFLKEENNALCPLQGVSAYSLSTVCVSHSSASHGHTDEVYSDHAKRFRRPLSEKKCHRAGTKLLKSWHVVKRQLLPVFGHTPSLKHAWWFLRGGGGTKSPRNRGLKGPVPLTRFRYFKGLRTPDMSCCGLPRVYAIVSYQPHHAFDWDPWWELVAEVCTSIGRRSRDWHFSEIQRRVKS